MVVSGVSNLVWMDSAHTVFDCVLATDTLGSIPFSCSMHDTNALAVQLWTDAVTNNKYGAIGAYVAPTLTPQQQVLNAIAGNVVVTSTANPTTLNGTYSIGPETQAKLNAAITYIMLNNKFPGGASVLPWSDVSGASHIFTDLATFKAFASSIADYVAGISVYSDSNGAHGAIPTSNNIAIP